MQDQAERRYDLRSDEFRANPYPTWSAMREQDPVYTSRWMISRPSWSGRTRWSRRCRCRRTSTERSTAPTPRSWMKEYFREPVAEATNTSGSRLAACTDRLDVTRENRRSHVGLGGGPHFCVGAALGRLETEVVLNAIIQQLPDLRVSADHLEWEASAMHRSAEEVPIRFTPS